MAIGLRGYGKSTWLSERCLDTVAEVGGAYVLGHSLGARMPERLPDGTELPISYHADLRRLDRALQSHPERWHILVGGAADPVIQYGRALAEGIKRRAWNAAGKVERWDRTRRMTGMRAPPVLIFIDELVALDAGAGNTQGKTEHGWFREWAFSLRHEHMALFAGIQNGAARSWVLLDQATAIHAFRTRHQWALELLRAAGASQDEIDRIRELPVGEHVTFG